MNKLYKQLIVISIFLYTITCQFAFAENSLGACVTIDEQLNASIPCVEYNSKYYKAELNAFNKPQEASNLYWSLANYDTATFINGCGFLDQALQLTLPCVSADKNNYKVKLKFLGPDFTWTLGNVNSFGISKLKPSVVTSGEVIIINGAGFASSSQITLAGEPISTKYISDNEIHGTIPFSKNEVNQLISYPAGIYEVKVDAGSAVNLTITELPENTQSNGIIWNEKIFLLKESLAKDAPAFLNNLQTQLDFYQENPETKQFIQGLADLISMFQSSDIQNELDKLQNQLDPVTLSTLERAVLSFQNNKVQAKINNNIDITDRELSSTSSVSSCENFTNGNDWLSCRTEAIPLANTLSRLTTVSTVCSLFYPPCMAGVLLATITNILNQIEIAKEIGLIKKIKLNISGTDIDERIDQSKSSMHLFINNYDNNEQIEKQTANARNITGATIFISHEANWFSIINELRGLTGMSSGNIKLDTLIDKISEITASSADKLIDKDFIQKDISIGNIADVKQALPFTTIYDEGDCNLNDFSGFHLQTTPEKKWIIPDIGPVSKPYTYQGTCKYGVKENLLLPWESGVE